MCLTKQYFLYEDVYGGEKPYGATMSVCGVNPDGFANMRRLWIEPERTYGYLKQLKYDIIDNQISKISINLNERGYVVGSRNSYQILLTEADTLNLFCLHFTKRENRDAVLEYLTNKLVKDEDVVQDGYKALSNYLVNQKIEEEERCRIARLSIKKYVRK